MFYRLIRDWRGYRAGKLFEPPPGVASILLRRKIVEPVESQAEAKPKKPPKRKLG